MSEPLREIEGTWEEVVLHEAELRGHHVKLTVFDTMPTLLQPEMKTERGRKFAVLRAAIVASGQPLLKVDELEREIKESRRDYDQNVS